MTFREPLAARLSLLLIAALLVSAGCRGTTKPRNGAVTEDSEAPTSPADGGAAPFSRATLLAAFGACAAANTAAFRDSANKLETAAAALASMPTEETRAAAREAFRRAMAVWQVAEMLQFGPTARTGTLGGQDFRDNIYAWPLFSRCAIEEEIIAQSYQSPQFATAVLANRRGLGALEYLLFHEGTETACTATSPALAAWTALAPQDIDARRLAYAAAASRDISARAATLHVAWDANGGNFPATLSAAGPGNAVYPSTQLALNSVANAVFYIESEVKDMKLAGPLGVDMLACPAEACPQLLESRFAGLSKANLAGNVDGLRRLLEGCQEGYDGLGFDDLLHAIGAGALAETLRVRAAAAQTALGAIEEEDLGPALTADKPSVKGLYDAIKGVTDLLKTEFASVLDIELPGDLGTDND